MQLACPYPVWTALLSLVLLVGLLVAVAHGPWRIDKPGSRFKLCAVAASSVWCMLQATTDVSHLSDLIAGASVLMGGLLAAFTVWSLIAWGFTTSLLLCLYNAEHPPTLDEWVNAYTEGRNVEGFARDRASVLLYLGVAQERGGGLRITRGRGHLVAAISTRLARVFGVRL